VKLGALIEEKAGSAPLLLEEAVFGSIDAEVVGAMIESFVSAELGAVLGAIFYSSSVGVAAGLRLMDGYEVVVKVHRWNVSLERLRDQQRVQSYLSEIGLSAPRPLAGPKPLGNGLAVIEEMRRGGVANGHLSGVREILARGLHEFISSARPLVKQVELGTPLVLQDVGEELWPEPHDLRFDFSGTSAGAEWIDDMGRAARRRLDGVSGESVIGHFDWRVQNLGITNGALSAIYDWDSLSCAPEPVIVGCAAAQFTAVWDGSTTNPLPSLEEMRRFVDLYQMARGSAFTRSERELLDAANLWSCAYGARCQHSDSVSSGTDAMKTAYGQLLRERGDQLLLI
jgi:hypothetical protein